MFSIWRIFLNLITFFYISFNSFSEQAIAANLPVRVVTSTTDLAWAVKEIGANLVSVESLLRGTEDPHFVDARPDYVAKVMRADVVCLIGLDLEVGWLPKVLTKSGRKEIQPGGKGYCDTGRRVEVLEKVSGGVDRSLGDVHPGGNPHFWLSPLAMIQAGLEIKDVLSQIDPKNKSQYEAGFKKFSQALTQTQQKLLAELKTAGLSGRNGRFFEYHREFSYFAQAYGLQSAGSIEEKPGVPPSAGRLSQVASLIKSSGVHVVLAASTAPRRVLGKIQEIAPVKVVVVPLSVRMDGAMTDYHQLQQYIVTSLITAHKSQR
jgi:zinc/manganese transport system substrate-binding protein